MLKQIVNGKSRRTIMNEMSSADATTLAGILVGKIEVYTLKSTIGSDIVVANPNPIKFSVGKKTGRVSRSATVYLPHRKAAKQFADIKTEVVGAFDEDFVSSTPCDYANMLLERN